MARPGRNPAQDTTLGGCRPLASYRTARDAQAVGAVPRFCRCGFWHRDYSHWLVAEELTAPFAEVAGG
jgi:hypothetical protein